MKMIEQIKNYFSGKWLIIPEPDSEEELEIAIRTLMRPLSKENKLNVIKYILGLLSGEGEEK